MCAHIPGLKVVFPATPYDAKGLMYSALTGTDPVIFFESQRIYDQPEEFVTGGVPAGYYEVPIGEPDVKKAGKDLTILTDRRDALPRARSGEDPGGEVRPLLRGHRRPLDRAVQLREGDRVGQERRARSCWLATPASAAAPCRPWPPRSRSSPSTNWTPRRWWSARATGSRRPTRSRTPSSRIPSDILDAVHEHILPLKGYTVARDCSTAELLRRSREGI